jgi:hypothetical protein
VDGSVRSMTRYLETNESKNAGKSAYAEEPNSSAPELSITVDRTLKKRIAGSAPGSSTVCSPSAPSPTMLLRWIVVASSECVALRDGFAGPGALTSTCEQCAPRVCSEEGCPTTVGAEKRRLLWIDVIRPMRLSIYLHWSTASATGRKSGYREK